MKKITRNDVADDSSSFSCLPDDIVLLILSKLVDLRTLCFCILVSKRFSRIVHQVDTISFTSFTDPAVDPPVASSSRSDWSAISCLKKFKSVKSLCIQRPSSFDTDSLFKWKIKFGNSSLDAFLFLTANSVYHNKELYDNANGHEQEEEARESVMKKADILRQCLKDVIVRIRLLLFVIISLPLLEKVTIEDSGRRGKISLGREKVTGMRNSLSSSNEVVEQVWHYIDSLCTTSGCYISLLELPVSKYVMKDVSLFLIGKDYMRDGSHAFFKRDNDDDDDDSEDKEEAAYSEAVVEIFKNHRERIKWDALV